MKQDNANYEKKMSRHTLNLSRGRHSPGRNPSWHLPSPSLLPPFQLKPPSDFSALDGFELIPSSWRTSLSSGDKRQKIIGFVENFCPNLVDPWDELSHLEDVFDEAGEDGEEVVEDGLVQTRTEDYVRLQQLHLCKEERLRRLLLFRLEEIQLKVTVVSCLHLVKKIPQRNGNCPKQTIGDNVVDVPEE